jgi:D-alanyl-D-alanine carboxypeptidase (penicillin-binding protein 5/6)
VEFKMKKTLLPLLMLACFFGQCDAKKQKASHKSTIGKVEKINKSDKAKQMILIDFDTGEVLFSKDGEERCVPSSMTKMMTAYIVFDAIESGKLKLEDMAPVSEFAKRKEGSRSFFESGTLAKVEDLIRSVIIHSGNDGCTILAEKIAGDEEAFAELMNEKASEFGLKNTHFVNSTGLPDDDHYSSLMDLAIIATRIIRDFPQYYHYFSEKSFTVNGITQSNRNTLLGNSMGVDGLKTGKTSSGGCGIVVSAKKNGKRLIAAVNGCKFEKIRMQEANRLLVSGFKQYTVIKIADKNHPVRVENVLFGKKDKVGLYCEEDVNVSLQKKYKDSLVVELNVKKPIKAPVLQNEKFGTLTYRYGQYVSKPYDLFAREAVQEVNIFKKLILMGVDFFSNAEDKMQDIKPSKSY